MKDFTQGEILSMIFGLAEKGKTLEEIINIMERRGLSPIDTKYFYSMLNI